MSTQGLAALLTSRSSPHERSATQWQGLIDSAVSERVAAALAPLVRDDANVPTTVRNELTRERYNTGARNILLYRELARVLTSSTESTPLVVLKGGALASTVYDDISLRPMSDLDVLVRKEHLATWKSSMYRLGYELVSPEMATGLAEAVHYQLAFRGSTGSPHRDVVIELHWNLVAGDADWRAPDIDWFWKQTEVWPGIEDLGCPPALQLNPLANVLYLSAHAMLQHGGARTRLVWLYDIHRLIERSRDAIDWRHVIDQAHELRWDAAVALALERCVELFGTPVPDDVVSEMKKVAAPETEAHVHGKSGIESSRAELVWREFLCLDAAGRLRLLLAILFPSPAYVKWRYPRTGALWPFAYVYRWSVVTREAVAYASRVLTSAFSFVFL